LLNRNNPHMEHMKYHFLKVCEMHTPVLEDDHKLSCLETCITEHEFTYQQLKEAPNRVKLI
jgi:hypothetical protein